MIHINTDRRRTVCYLQGVMECDLCDEQGECLLILPPSPWSGINICEACWAKLSELFSHTHDEEPKCAVS